MVRLNFNFLQKSTKSWAHYRICRTERCLSSVLSTTTMKPRKQVAFTPLHAFLYVLLCAFPLKRILISNNLDLKDATWFCTVGSQEWWTLSENRLWLSPLCLAPHLDPSRFKHQQRESAHIYYWKDFADKCCAHSATTEKTMRYMGSSWEIVIFISGLLYLG